MKTLIPFIMLFSATATAAPCSDFKLTHLLLGQWQSTSSKHQINESWQIIDDKHLIGSSVTTSISKPNKPPFVESLRVIKMADEIFYIAKPPQNPMPTPFKLTQCDNNRLRFENPDHDFPKVIEYHKSGNKLIATVTNGAEQGFKIEYVKF